MLIISEQLAAGCPSLPSFFTLPIKYAKKNTLI